jgi:hypothetical protein
MKPAQRHQQGKAVFDLIEEATHLLRGAPAATLAVYYAGAIPFVLGLLFFWAEMSRSPLAPQHLAGGSLGLTALFLWMKCCQAIFARRLRAQAAGQPPTPLSARRCARIFFAQAVIQPSGLFLLPVALVPTLPFPWVYAFYQNVSALDDGGEAAGGSLLKNARRQAALWPRQNFLMLGIMMAFAGCLFLNWLTVCLTLPGLFKMLLGIESDFTRSPLALLNSTFCAAMAGLTYLSVDPLFKAIYTLRCFYGESRQSGEDLKAELKPFVQTALKRAALLAVLLAVCAVSPVKADTTNSPAGPTAGRSLSPPALDRAINQTIHENKYTWRMPRQQAVAADADEGVFEKFLDKIGHLLRDWVKAALNWIDKMLDKLYRILFPRRNHVESSGYGWIMSLQFLLYGLAAAAIIALIIFLYRVFREQHKPAPAVAGEAIQPVPDLTDENVRADQMPEDGWTQLARELLARGEFRLAMRAFYLSALARLAARNLISIARFKSNRDYERELRRRAHAFPALLDVFAGSVSVFESVWYGMHETNRELVDRFAAELDRLKGEG